MRTVDAEPPQSAAVRSASLTANAHPWIAFCLLALAFLLLASAVAVVLGHSRLAVGALHIRFNKPDTLLGWAGACGAAGLWAGRRRRRLVAIAAAAIALTACGALVVIATHAQPMAEAGDPAVIESYTIEASHFAASLGPYSRFGWHHPGPLYFYWLAPFFVSGGEKAAALAAGALALNLLSLGIVAAVAFAYAGNLVTASAIVAATAAYGYHFRPLLASTWNPHVLPLATAAFIIVAAALASGAFRLLPLLALIASFLCQTHLGLVPFTGALSAVALAAAVVSLPRDAWPSMCRTVNATAWAMVVVWAPPVVQQFTHQPGNLRAIWDFFLTGHATLPWTVAFGAWSGITAGWLQAAVGIPIGVPQLAPAPVWVRGLAVAQVGAVAAIGVLAARARQRFCSALAALLVVGYGVSLWSITRIVDAIYDHEIFWMSVLSPIAIGLIAGWAATRRWQNGRRWVSTVAVGAAALAVTSFAIAGVHALSDVVERSSDPFDANAAAGTIADAIRARDAGRVAAKPLILIDQSAWAVAAGVIAELQRSHACFAIDPGVRSMFDEALQPDGFETEEIVIGASERHAALSADGAAAIAARRGYFADLVPPTAPGYSIRPPAGHRPASPCP